MVVPNIGMTMTEAVDDVPEIRRALADTPITRAYVHAGAGLSGVAISAIASRQRALRSFCV